MRVKRRYEPAFRQDAIALMESTGRSLSEVASSLGVPQMTMRYWYAEEMKRRGKAKPGATGFPTETPQQKLARLERENAALRKENTELKLDKEILKKAAAFFAKESK